MSSIWQFKKTSSGFAPRRTTLIYSAGSVRGLWCRQRPRRLMCNCVTVYSAGSVRGLRCRQRPAEWLTVRMEDAG